jgi:hypothetical protein
MTDQANQNVIGPPGLDGGSSFVGFNTAISPGYIFAPYVPILITKEEIKEHTRVPIKLIKAAMNQAGYKFNRDFEISRSGWGAHIFVTSRPGRRFDHYGQCQASITNGKMNISWTYEPTPGGKATQEVDIHVANPNCFPQISETIVRAFKENRFRPISSGYAKRIHASYYGKVTI